MYPDTKIIELFNLPRETHALLINYPHTGMLLKEAALREGKMAQRDNEREGDLFQRVRN